MGAVVSASRRKARGDGQNLTYTLADLASKLPWGGQHAERAPH